MHFDFVKGEGPSIDNPCARPPTSIACAPSSPALGHVLETIRILRRELDGRVPLIGFGGAPFTLAAYAIEGGPSRDYFAPRRSCTSSRPRGIGSARSSPTSMTTTCIAQVAAGAQALQIFDSWAGALGRSDYREFVLPHTTPHLRWARRRPACR